MFEVVKYTKIRNSIGTSKIYITFKDDDPNLKHQKLFVFEDIKGKSHKWSNIMYRAQKAAQVTSTVLIEGESGTGKEMIAQAIHTGSGRKGLFVPINCGADS